MKILRYSYSRVSALSSGGEERARQLAGVARDGGAGAAQGFLAGSVLPPWERAVTPANVPYYIEYVFVYFNSPTL